MKKRHLKFALKGIATSTLIATLFIQVLYVAFEPTKADALTANDNVVVTLIVDPGITISDGANCTMLGTGSANMGVTINKVSCSSAWTVVTNNAAGYTLAVKATTAPAMSGQFADYTPGTPGTPELWSMTVSATNKEFGFSAHGTDVPTGTWGTPAAGCGTSGNPDTGLKYHNTATSDKTIATRATVTSTSGVLSTICFQAEQANGVYAASGTYTATITGTATTL